MTATFCKAKHKGKNPRGKLVECSFFSSLSETNFLFPSFFSRKFSVPHLIPFLFPLQHQQMEEQAQPLKLQLNEAAFDASWAVAQKSWASFDAFITEIKQQVTNEKSSTFQNIASTILSLKRIYVTLKKLHQRKNETLAILYFGYRLVNIPVTQYCNNLKAHLESGMLSKWRQTVLTFLMTLKINLMPCILFPNQNLPDASKLTNLLEYLDGKPAVTTSPPKKKQRK